MKALCSMLLLSVLVGPFAASAVAQEPAAGKIRVLLFVGGHAFDEKPFFAMFDRMTDVTYTVAHMPKDASLLKPGLETQYDVLVMYDMTGSITPDQQKAFIALLNTGIGFVPLHHNLGAHRNWDEYRKMIGGKYVFNDGVIDGQACTKSSYAHDQDMNVTIVDPEHPITKGLKDFQIHDETYKDFYTAPNTKVLLKTDHPKNDPELAWVHTYGKSRVFYLMLGHDAKAYQNPAYPELIHRGIRWTAGR
jgi:type 1 glutamine amidotransferase